jgi:hypothetical protein
MPRSALTQARCLTYWLTGPGLISNYDLAAVQSKLLGRTISYRELTSEENKDAMIRAEAVRQSVTLCARPSSTRSTVRGSQAREGPDPGWVAPVFGLTRPFVHHL